MLGLLITGENVSALRSGAVVADRRRLSVEDAMSLPHSVQLSAEFKLEWVTSEGWAVTASQLLSPRAGIAAPVLSADQPSFRSLHMKGCIGKLWCTWLVDTGAVVSCVSAALPGINSIPYREPGPEEFVNL